MHAEAFPWKACVLGYPDMVFWWRVQRSDACPSACLGGVRRVLQITELVRDCLQQRDANCSITPRAARVLLGRQRGRAAAGARWAPAAALLPRLCHIWACHRHQIKCNMGPGRVAKVCRSPSKRAAHFCCGLVLHLWEWRQFELGCTATALRLQGRPPAAPGCHASRIWVPEPSLDLAVLRQRCACKDATPASPLRKIVTAKSQRRLHMGADAAPTNEVTSESERDEFRAARGCTGAVAILHQEDCVYAHKYEGGGIQCPSGATNSYSTRGACACDGSASGGQCGRCAAGDGGH